MNKRLNILLNRYNESNECVPSVLCLYIALLALDSDEDRTVACRDVELIAMSGLALPTYYKAIKILKSIGAIERIPSNKRKTIFVLFI